MKFRSYGYIWNRKLWTYNQYQIYSEYNSTGSKLHWYLLRHHFRNCDSFQELFERNYQWTREDYWCSICKRLLHLHFRVNRKAVRILLSILKRNFEEFNAVERTIQRLSSEIDIILKNKTKSKSGWNEWKYIQSPNEVVHMSQRQEFIRVMLRLLNSSVFKNNPSQGDFNPNFVSNSRKILDSGLFETWLELFTENIEKNLHTHDVAMVSWMHLITFVFYDLPAQIYKACEHLLPNLFNSLEKRIPNWNGFYIALLKLITAVTVHEKGRECLKYITTHRKVY